MANKVNTKSVSAQSLETLNNFYAAFMADANLYAQLRKDCKPYRESIKKTQALREEFTKNGGSVEESIEKYSVAEDNKQIEILRAKYEQDSKPYKDAMQEALKMYSDEMYYAYKLAMDKYSASATGTIAIKDGTFKVEKSFSAQLKDVIVNMGYKSADDKNSQKFANAILLTAISMKKSKDENLMKVRNKREVFESITLCIIKYSLSMGDWIVDNGVLKVKSAQ